MPMPATTIDNSGMSAPPEAQVFQLGLVRAGNLTYTQQVEDARKVAVDKQAQPMLQGMAGHVRKAWSLARDSKQQHIEQRMLENLRARRGEYDPDKLMAIRAAGGSEVYAGLTSVKCRAAASWMRDVLSAGNTGRAWSIEPTPIPDLPPELNLQIVKQVAAQVQAAIMQGVELEQDAVVQMMADMRAKVLNEAKQAAREKAENMANKMEDQLDEGGFRQALDAFLDDITTFPAAILKGPILRRKPRIAWLPAGQGSYTPQVHDEIVMEWERVSPFDIYPSPGATSINDGSMIERHRLSRADLQDMIGVQGYDDGAIRLVLEDYSRGGLKEWLIDEVARAEAEGQDTVHAAINSEGLIDALQYWGSVSGRHLLDWGMTSKQVPDPLKEYQVECWLVGRHVIRAVLNHDPLRRRPYYKASYEEVPGAFWGNAVADLVRDAQLACNAALRALVNNMSMASGPQVSVNIDRLAPGENLTTLTPWKIWQVTSDPLNAGSNQVKPIEFFQPNSNADTLMAIYEKFSQMADEYSGIPKYLSGDTTGGAGRTASGLSMLIGNAAKSLKAVLGNIDINVIEPLLMRQYDHNMLYADDPDLKGDVRITARGSSALVAKESAQVRRNEFLAATTNPIDMQIVGLTGRAAILRETAKNLDMNPDAIVPSDDELRARMAAAALAPPQDPKQGPTPANPTKNGQTLMDGSPITDNIGPA